MSRSDDRRRLAQSICEAAKIYKNKLVGKKFLYVFDGRYIEVMFKKQNFKHLTGVVTALSAMVFYDNAVRGTLSGNQISINAEHPYELCCKKIRHLLSIESVVGGESLMQEEIVAEKGLFKFGTTNLDFTLCLDKEYDNQGNILNEYHIAKSLRDGDCFSKSNEVYEITHIFSSQNNEKLYSKLLYMDKSLSLNDLPENIIHMLNNALLK